MLSLRRKPKPKLPKATGRVIVIEEHHRWGDNLFWWAYPGDRRGSTGWVLGTHLPRRPVCGDEVRSRASGQRWLVTAVNLVRDPPDMFFATCVPLAGSETPG